MGSWRAGYPIPNAYGWGYVFAYVNCVPMTSETVRRVTRTAYTYHKSYTQTPAVNVQDGGIVTIRNERVSALSPQDAQAARNQFLLEAVAAARGHKQLFHVRHSHSELAH
jgi:hypothetical protein